MKPKKTTNEIILHNILGIVLILAFCDRHSPAWEKLQEVETYIEEHADSALLVFQDIWSEGRQMF